MLGELKWLACILGVWAGFMVKMRQEDVIIRQQIQKNSSILRMESGER